MRYTIKEITSFLEHVPNLETLENIMKLSPMIVQALWDRQSPLLQLPHITEDMQRHFVTRKVRLRFFCLHLYISLVRLMHTISYCFNKRCLIVFATLVGAPLIQERLYFSDSSDL